MQLAESHEKEPASAPFIYLRVVEDRPATKEGNARTAKQHAKDDDAAERPHER